MEKINTKKKNYFLGILHGVFFNTAMSFANQNTVIPVFLNYFISSKTLIGLFSSLMRLGNIIPQIFTAHILESKTKKMPTMIGVLTSRFFCFFISGIIAFFFSGNIVWISIVILLFIYSFAGGIGAIPFYDIIAKTIDKKRRGLFFAQRLFWGNLAGIAAGIAIKYILASHIRFPKNYGVIILLASAMLAIAYISFGFIKEPPQNKIQKKRSLLYFLQDTKGIFLKNRAIKIMILSEILSGSIFLSLPFLSIYAKDIIHKNVQIVGYFISSQMAGMVLSNLWWGPLSRKFGNRTVIILSNVFSSLSILIFIINHNLIILTFFLFGCYLSGRNIGYANYNLDIAPEEKRTIYISLRGTFISIIWIFPAIGGLLIDIFSYQILFTITLITTILSIIFSLTLPEAGRVSQENRM